MLRSAFIFYSVGRYDVKGKQLLKTLGKNYIIDMGFRNMLLGYRDADRGHIIENIVFQAKESRSLTDSDADIEELMKELISNHTIG